MMGYALEARMLFDGAIAATTEAAASQNTTDTNTSSSDSSATSEHTDNAASDQSKANSDSANSDNNTDSSELPTAISALSDVASTSRKEVVFVDTSVSDYETLLEGIPDSMEVVLLDSSSDELSQMASWASSHQGYDAIHILSHGSEGAIQLGGLTLDSDTATSRSADLATLGAALTDSGDILLYGCEVAEDTGAAYIQQLSQLTSADIAASTDTTGAESLGGNWTLEAATGSIESESLAVTDYSGLLDETVIGNMGADATNDSVGGFSIAQSFTATITGQLTEIRIVNADFDDGSSWTLKVYDGDGVSGTQLGTTQTGASFGQDATSLTGYSGYSSIVLETPINIVAGQQYTFSFTPAGALDFLYADSSNYSGGSMYYSFDNGASYDNSGGQYDVIFSVVQTTSSIDATSTLTSSSALTEPTTIATTSTNSGSATALLDFTINDLGTSDGLATNVSSVSVAVSGTATAAELNNMTFTLSDGTSTLGTGTYNSGTNSIDFSGVNLSIADGGSKTYTISAYFSDDTNSADITEGHTVGLSIGTSNLTLGSSSSSFASGTDVSNGSGAAIDITATQLVYSQSPSSTVVSGSTFTTQPTVYAVDARGNIDSDYTGTISLTEDSAGSLSGTTSKAAVAGVASFTNLAYTASADQETLALTASSGALSSVSSGSITADVVATKLIYSTQPTPTTIQSGDNTSFTTAPVILAVDANNTVDTGYSTDIRLQVTDPNDAVIDGTVNSMTGTGDTDGSGTTVTLTPVNGVASFSGLTLQYTNSGATETLALLATSGSLTNTISSSITSTTNSAPAFTNLNGSVSYTENGSAVVLDGDVSVSDTELDALNSGNGNYAGSSLTLVRSGGANSDDTFIATGLLSTLTQGSDLSYNGTVIGTVTTNSGGTLVITFNSNATTALMNQAIQSLAYSNSSDNPPTTVTLNWTFNDGTINSTGTNQSTVNITPVNDAPTMTDGTTIHFPGTTEDTTSSAIAISNILIASGYADVDSSAQGIAINATTGSGTWQYSTDGVNWISVGSVSSTSALLLSSTSQIRYVPDGQNGETATFTYKGWDQSQGTASSSIRSTADITSSGGSTAFSSATLTTTIGVSSQNDAPTLTNGATATLTATDENTASSGTQLSSLLTSLGYSDVDTGAISGLAITGSTGNGSWQYSTDNVTWTGIGSVSASAALLLSSSSYVRYVPDGSNSETATLIVKGWDQTSGTASTAGSPSQADSTSTGGTTAFSTNSAILSQTVTAVNDAPTLTNSTVTLTTTNEDSSSAGVTISSLLTASGYGDVDTSANSGIAISAVSGNGSWEYSTDGVTWVSVGTVSTSSALLLSSSAQIRYSGDNANGETATFSFAAWDQTSGSASTNSTPQTADISTRGGSSAFSSLVSQASITVTSVNDAPSLSQATVSLGSITENASNTQLVSDLLISAGLADVDTGALSGIAITALSGNSNWQYSTDGTTWLNMGSVSSSAALLLSSSSYVRYSGDTYNGETASLTIKAWDQTTGTATSGGIKGTADTSTSGGTSAFSADNTTFSLTVTDINDSPTLNGATVSIGSTDENTTSSAYQISSFSSAINYNDVDTGAVGGVAITALNGNGTWQYSTDGTTWTNVGSVSSTQALLLASTDYVRYMPDGDNGETASLTVKGWDQTSGSASVNGAPSYADTSIDGGSTAFSSQTSIANLTVTAVNDAPTSIGISNQTATEDAAFSYTVPTNTFSDVDVGDTLTYSATLAGGGALPSWLSFDAATQTFSGTPTNANVGAISVMVTATDGSNASVSSTFTLTVGNTNDAPTSTGISNQTATEDTAFSFTVPTNTFSDVDVGDTLTYSATLAGGGAL
ncbi:DUF4347 domain-containing protein, partial [Pokkaliibacter sp. CJK22405]|uniref:DUF4347 domain-containing protein n=1 Tax=Pokkaliibacter sp. CJK22405 TaxID=3384615 RepID=UPI00398534D2